MRAAAAALFFLLATSSLRASLCETETLFAKSDFMLQPNFLEKLIKNFDRLSPRMQRFLRSGALAREARSPLARLIQISLSDQSNILISEPARIEASLFSFSGKKTLWFRWVALNREARWWGLWKSRGTLAVGQRSRRPKSTFVQILAGAMQASLIKIAAHSQLSSDDFEIAAPIESPYVASLLSELGFVQQDRRWELLLEIDQEFLHQSYLAGRDTSRPVN